MKRVAGLVLTICTVVASDVSAQDTRSLRAGDRLRVTTRPGDMLVGSLTEVSSESLELQVADGGEVAVVFDDVAKVERYAGNRGGFGKGALRGGLIMTGVVVLVAATSGGDIGDAGALVLAAPILVGGGIVVGGMLGAADRWITVPLHEAGSGGRLSIALHRFGARRVGVGVQIVP